MNPAFTVNKAGKLFLHRVVTKHDSGVASLNALPAEID